MKPLLSLLLLTFSAFSGIAGAAPVATTAGSNLTAYNSSTAGSINNNQWNSMTNSRTGEGKAPVADFGNCNAVIMRCAQPKCAGCTSMDVAVPIVTGCVMDNATCKKHGNDLINAIAAQIVANASANANAAANAASAAAAAQTSQQMAEMQASMNAQMQQMAATMQAQNNATVAQLQSALAEQKQMAAAAQEELNAMQRQQIEEDATGLTMAQQEAAAKGIDADLLVREQISGQILSKLENAQTSLKQLNVTMQEAFKYAGCDTRGNNCAGPKRVKMFKDKALQFFDPYDTIVDQAYEALEMALAVGVDVSDVIMMLSGSCNKWGKFMCRTGSNDKDKYVSYDKDSCPNGRSVKHGRVKGGMECSPGANVPPQDDTACTLISFLENGDEVERQWVVEADEDDGLVRVGCATSALDSISIFGRRSSRQGAALDLDTLERIILQDAPEYISSNRYSSSSSGPEVERLKYCALTPAGYQRLLAAVNNKKLPSNICVSSGKLATTYKTEGSVASGTWGGSGLSAGNDVVPVDCAACTGNYLTAAMNSGLGDCKLKWVEDYFDKDYNHKTKDWGTGKCPTDAERKQTYGDGYKSASGRCVVVNTNKCIYKDGAFVQPETKSGSATSGGDKATVSLNNTILASSESECTKKGGLWLLTSRTCVPKTLKFK